MVRPAVNKAVQARPQHADGSSREMWSTREFHTLMLICGKDRPSESICPNDVD